MRTFFTYSRRCGERDETTLATAGSSGAGLPHRGSEMSTYKQRQASRRNLVKARTARRRKAGHSRSMSAFEVKFLLLAVALILVVALIDVTRGLILLPIVGLVVGSIWLHQRHKKDAARRAEALRVERLLQAQHLDALLAVSPTEFEHIVADLFAAIGFIVLSAGGGAGDLGADIVCQNPEGHRFVVQCKRYAPGNKVTSPAMQSFIGMAHRHHGAAGIYVTTSSYTKAAADLAQQHGIDLYDGERLVGLARWVQSRGSSLTSGP